MPLSKVKNMLPNGQNWVILIVKQKKGLKELLKRHFNNVYIFSMNDEVLHTGFDSMSHYILAISKLKK